MSLYKRGNVYWSAIWIDGVRTMRSLETSNRRQAETLEQRFRDELHTKRFQLPNFKPEMPFAELYGRFLAEGDVKPHHRDRAKTVNTATKNTGGRRPKKITSRFRKPPLTGTLRSSVICSSGRRTKASFRQTPSLASAWCASAGNAARSCRWPRRSNSSTPAQTIFGPSSSRRSTPGCGGESCSISYGSTWISTATSFR